MVPKKYGTFKYQKNYPLVTVSITMENHGKSPCSMGKSTISTGPWLQVRKPKSSLPEGKKNHPHLPICPFPAFDLVKFSHGQHPSLLQSQSIGRQIHPHRTDLAQQCAAMELKKWSGDIVGGQELSQ